MMMRTFAIEIVAALCLVAISVASPGWAQTANVDQTTSDAVTKYLHKNRLPMVGAQVTNTAAGRQLMLYGFVATDFGKQDAETKSKRYLHDSGIPIVNNIRVNPQVRHLKKRSTSSPEAGAGMNDPSAPPPEADWERTVDTILRSGGAVPSNDPSLKMPTNRDPTSPPPGW